MSSSTTSSKVRSVPGSLPQTAYQNERKATEVAKSSRIRRLDDQGRQKSIAEVQCENSLTGEWAVSTWIWIILVPVLVWIILLLLAPTFVLQTKDGNQVDHRQMILWTLVISAIIWILLWSLNYCKSC